MLGKRFRRTTSMSHLGTGCSHDSPPEKSDKKAQAMVQEYNFVCYAMPPSTAAIQNEGWHIADCGSDMTMVQEFDPPHMLTDVILTENPPTEDHEELLMPVYTPSPLVPCKTGIWTHHQFIGLVPHVSPARLQHMSAQASFISPVDFLDVCFYCKRRLKHERDIFIYRGDSAFCSEDCRHRQILSDERRSMRGANNKGGGARETAVAA